MTTMTQWAQEYTTEAEALKARIEALKPQLAHATCTQAKDLNRRIAILYTMYLECRQIGRLLAEHPLTLREQTEQKGDCNGNKAV